MNELLALAVEAHGGLSRWDGFSSFRLEASFNGAIWVRKSRPGLLEDVVLEVDTYEQRMAITPFPAIGQSAIWTPDRQAIETADGRPISERRDPAVSFVGLLPESPWDHFQVAYFAGLTSWSSLVAPFVLARPGFVIEEIEPGAGEEQLWRRLLVTYPETIAAHSRRQTYSFDDAGLIRRVDYEVDILGGGSAALYLSDHRDFDGIAVATRHRVYARHADARPVWDTVWVAIDVADVSFT
jgi:hypothetical protein